MFTMQVSSPNQCNVGKYDCFCNLVDFKQLERTPPQKKGKKVAFNSWNSRRKGNSGKKWTLSL